jgi:hypothetical protein
MHCNVHSACVMSSPSRQPPIQSVAQDKPHRQCKQDHCNNNATMTNGSPTNVYGNDRDKPMVILLDVLSNLSPPLHVQRMMVHHSHHQGEDIGKVLVRVPRQGQEGGGIEDTLMNHRSGCHGRLWELFYSIFLQSQVSTDPQSRRPPRLSENISFSWGGGYPLHFVLCTLP